MKKKVTGLIAVAGLGLVLNGCSGGAEANKEQATVEKPAVAVETAIVSLENFAEEIEVTGELTPKFSVDVRSELKGIVREVAVTEWVRVKKGDLLARLDAEEDRALAQRAEAGVAAAQAAIIEAQAQAGRARREEERMQQLKEAGLATRQEVENSITDQEAAAARVAAGQAQLAVAEEERRQARVRLAKAVIRSPIDGTISLRAVNIGDLATDSTAGPPLFRVVDNRILQLTVTIPAPEMAAIRPGLPLRFGVEGLPGRELVGEVKYINPEVRATDRSLKVLAEVDNASDELKSGMFVKGRIVIGERTGIILVPRAALSSWDGSSGTGQVLIVENNTAKRQEVTTGSVLGDKVEIASGLAAGARYITRGGFAVQDGDRVAEGGAGTEPSLANKLE